MLNLAQIEKAADLVHAHMPATPQYSWPLLNARAGCEVWVKHENHTPTGAFKVRGGLIYLDEYARAGSKQGLITATTGNHGQSIPWSARRYAIPVTIYVPHANSPEKNAAMRALGVELVEFGADFDAAWPEAQRIAEARNLHFVTSFNEHLVRGVSTYALEFFAAHADLDAVYVPIGMGSGICGVISARDGLGLATKVIGVVAERAPAVAQSFEARRPIASNSSATFAAGLACRSPAKAAIDVICAGAERIVRVSEDEIAAAMRNYFTDTHNLAEGAGAAALAALLKERHEMAGKKVGLVLSGGNVDAAELAHVLGGNTPEVGARR